MATDPNDVDGLIENLVDIFRKAVLKGVNVRVDENGEMIVTYEDVERVRVSATGKVVEVNGEKVPDRPLSELLRRPGESEGDAEKRLGYGSIPSRRTL